MQLTINISLDSESFRHEDNPDLFLSTELIALSVERVADDIRKEGSTIHITDLFDGEVVLGETRTPLGYYGAGMWRIYDEEIDD